MLCKPCSDHIRKGRVNRNKELPRCKLALEDHPIEQIMASNYLGVEITTNPDRT